MLSKEEIEKIEELSHYCALKNIDREDNVFGEFVVTMQKIRNYIKQLESDKQKLIEKLEEDIEIARKEYRITLSDRQDGIRAEAQEILKLAKGEKE